MHSRFCDFVLMYSIKLHNKIFPGKDTQYYAPYIQVTKYVINYMCIINMRTYCELPVIRVKLSFSFFLCKMSSKNKADYIGELYFSTILLLALLLFPFLSMFVYSLEHGNYRPRELTFMIFFIGINLQFYTI